MIRYLYFVAGFIALGLGFIGVFLPLVPTVPFVILAAFCFTRGSPRFEAWLLDHPHLGPPIHAWRRSGAISRKGKWAATIGLSGSGVLGLVFLPWPWSVAPMTIALVSGAWIWSRPDG
ncbi:YbaN family protein [Sphingomonas sp. S1-29]|uniref:YbaN family protein n=1 Tax=Sphingomonas sp. S1-29 TaxID=2991074 RepID=UPI00223F9B18|nr:YbaN family protein [Sphingomonas sp. S1-29]UZK71078.1 YbaN family protein [Sphingomonas sp. S1-29]